MASPVAPLARLARSLSPSPSPFRFRSRGRAGAWWWGAWRCATVGGPVTRLGSRTGALAAFLAVAPVAVLSAGCTDASRTDAPGNVVVDDTRDQPRPPANPDPPSSGSDAAVADAGPAYPADAPDGYAPLSACGECACAAPGNYCFGGGSPRTARASSAPADDAALPACTLADPGGTQPGCYAVPAACTATPTCACVLNALQPRLACYLVCAAGDPMRVYCPSP